MQCKDIEVALETDELAALSESARLHLASCVSCRNTVADFKAILEAAHTFQAEVEPPARIWVSLRAQLAAEGLIHEPASAPVVAEVPWWQPIAQLFSQRALAVSLVGCLLVAAAILELRRPSAPAEAPAATASSAPSASSGPVDDQLFHTAQTLDEQEHDLSNMIQASTSPVDTSLRQNLKDLDEFIAECERHLKQSPHDQLAREYLAAAYQQKAELLSAMIDRGRSVN
ncbi:MAG TPA: hypothetical protein VJP87_00295 [Candidatus Acidoferrales bacterium]|nr:hypothetical protein [Candidatus Acidoferrales bacterium]